MEWLQIPGFPQHPSPSLGETRGEYRWPFSPHAFTSFTSPTFQIPAAPLCSCSQGASQCCWWSFFGSWAGAHDARCVCCPSSSPTAKQQSCGKVGRSLQPCRALAPHPSCAPWGWAALGLTSLKCFYQGQGFYCSSCKRWWRWIP